MNIIDIEAHFYTQAYIEHLRSRKGVPREDFDGNTKRLWYTDELWIPQNTKMEEKCLDLGEGRLRDMDESGTRIQVLGLNAPHVQQFEPAEGVEWAKNVNDELSGVVKKYPDRFIGLAAIAPQSPQEAANEIERAVTKLGLKGVIIQSHALNEYLDAKKYWVIFEMAEKLDVPIYIHPTVPSQSILKPFIDYGWSFVSAPFGYQVETSLHVVRLIFSGLFDKYPNLKIILGHLGEGLPYWLYRLDFRWLKPVIGSKLPVNRKPSEYFKTNFYVTISGMYYQPAFMCAYLALGADRIMFATDYPHESYKSAIEFLNQLPICDKDKEKIGYLNAERLFKL